MLEAVHLQHHVDATRLTVTTRSCVGTVHNSESQGSQSPDTTILPSNQMFDSFLLGPNWH